MSKRHSKKLYTKVRINAADAQQLALMLRLHYAQCIDNVANASKFPTLDERQRRSIKSWNRLARKAWEFAGQFDAIAADARNWSQAQELVTLH